MLRPVKLLDVDEKVDTASYGCMHRGVGQLGQVRQYLLEAFDKVDVEAGGQNVAPPVHRAQSVEVAVQGAVTLDIRLCPLPVGIGLQYIRASRHVLTKASG